MKQRDDNYHVQIKPELLFDVYKKFKSVYTPWVYTYLKLDYNNYIFNSPNRFYKIDRKPISDFFNTDPATISRAFKQLVDNGLMEKKKHEYRLLNDLTNDLFPKMEGFHEFIQINNNFFIDFGDRVKSVSGDNKDRSLVKAMEVFYYLITKNSHILIDTPVLSSDETSKSISKGLRHDENYIKDYLGVLESVGQIEIDDEGNISTAYGCGTSPLFKKSNNFSNVKEHSDSKELFQVADNNVEEKIQEQQKPVPVTDNERIGYIMAMSNGNAERLNELLYKFKISDESFKAYLASY